MDNFNRFLNISQKAPSLFVLHLKELKEHFNHNVIIRIFVPLKW